MIEPSFMEEMDNGNFFDSIDNLLDFPSEDLGSGLGFGDSNALPSIWSTQPERLPASDSIFSGKSNSDNSAELYVPFEEIVQMEWLSSFGDDSFSGGSLSLTTDKNENSSSTNDSASHNQFRTSSPVSVLESSSSSSVTKTAPSSPEHVAAAPGKRGRLRTKRPRPPKQSESSIPLSDEKEEKDKEEEKDKDKDKDSLCSVTESRLVIRIPKHVLSEHKMKNKKPKVSPVVGQEGNKSQEEYSEQLVRKCMHCEVTKTPQWRLGPMGPKTLCNACGVRYKSGRLFPEYRPAASPTFVPSLHSNSHKKVAEMRSKKVETVLMTKTETTMSDLPELIPNFQHEFVN